MSAKTEIQWTNSTWNCLRGCSRVSRGCGGPGKFGGCYAEGIAARFSGPGMPFEGFAERKGGEARWTGKVALIEHLLDLPLRWKEPRKIFVNSMSDLGHEGLSDMDRSRVFGVMKKASHHTYQVLTKRPEVLWSFVKGREPMPHVWLGTSVEDQESADMRRDALRKIAAADWLTFVSYEPALGPVNWSGWEFIAWMISGGESGKRARPTHPQWHRDTRDWCAAHDIAYFFKQWGEWLPGEANIGQFDAKLMNAYRRCDNHQYDWPQATGVENFGTHPDRWSGNMTVRRVGKKRAGRLLDGVEHNAYPVTA